MILVVLWLKRQGALTDKLANENHLHDLGKLMFAFTVFSGLIFPWLAGVGSTNSASSLNLDIPYYALNGLNFIVFYLFAMVLTQIKPRTTGRYF